MILFTLFIFTLVPAWAVINPVTVEKLLAVNCAAYDYFGTSVSVDGDIAVIGAYGDDTNGSEGGAAYVFIRRENSKWELQKKQ